MSTPRVQAKQSPVRQTTHAYSHRYRCSAILESDLELDYFHWRCFEGEFTQFQMQPAPLFYEDEMGKEHRFTADAELIELDGTHYIDEVKYTADAIKPHIHDKHARVDALYRDDDKVFRVITDHDIRVGERADNLRILAPTWAWPAPVEEVQQLTHALPYHDAPIRDLFKTSQYLGLAPCLLRRAIGHRLITCDITQPWDQLHLHW